MRQTKFVQRNSLPLPFLSLSLIDRDERFEQKSTQRSGDVPASDVICDDGQQPDYQYPVEGERRTNQDGADDYEPSHDASNNVT